MIGLTNQNYIYDSDRRDIMERALYSQPYFYKVEFEAGISSANNKVFAQVLGIDKDFYLTEIQADISEVFSSEGYEITVYTGYNRSVYHYLAGRLLPTPFVVTDAPFRTTPDRYDDRQFESLPFLIRKNDKVYIEVRSLSSDPTTIPFHVVLKGFSLLDNTFVTEQQAEQLYESLSNDVEWTIFKVDVTDEPQDRGIKSYILENDNKSRLILGFGAINTTANKGNVSEINLSITEIAKRLKFSDVKIPLGFIAPRLTCLQDTHLYYLPIEFYWQPYSKLQFDVDNIWLDSDTPAGAEIAVLTRTI